MAIFLSAIMGTCTPALRVLLIFLALDFLASFFSALRENKNSAKEILGAEISKLIAIFALLAVGYQLDILFQSAILREACVYFYVASAAVSILDGCVKLGVPLPPPLVDAVQRMKEKTTKGSADVQPREEGREDDGFGHQ